MTEPTTPLNQWSEIVSKYAEANIRPSSKQQSLATALLIDVRGKLTRMGLEGSAMELNEATVAGWLAGSAAPQTPQIHAALMEAFLLPEMRAEDQLHTLTKEAESKLALAELFGDKAPFERTVKQPALDERGKRKAEHRQNLEALYAQIPDDAKIVLTELAPKTRAPRKPKVAETTGPVILDNPYLPPREFDPASYERIERADCTLKMAETDNIHEFLTLYRLHRKQHIHSKEEAMEAYVRMLGLSASDVAAYESGASLPDAAALGQYKKIMSGPDAQRLDDLNINNRLTIAAKMRARQHSNGFDDTELEPLNRSIDAVLDEMPQHYWRAQLDRAHDPKSFAARSNLPGWVENMPPIECREDYLRAIRGHLGKSAALVEYELRDQNVPVSRLEDSFDNVDSRVGRTLRDHLAKQEPLFKKDFYRDQLGSAYTPEIEEAPVVEKPKSSQIEKVAKQRKPIEPYNEFLGPSAQPKRQR